LSREALQRYLAALCNQVKGAKLLPTSSKSVNGEPTEKISEKKDDKNKEDKKIDYKKKDDDKLEKHEDYKKNNKKKTR